MITHEPASVEEASAVMALTGREKHHVIFIGGGTQQDLGNPPVAIDAEIRTGRMNRILDYAPADMVITAEAGVTLSQVQETAREHRQMLALDPPRPDVATIGGLVATGAYGPRRARYGAIRDLIIGVTLIRPDGVVARGGGKVVKNVAGFDLPKVACGSLGTLAMIGTATFRLHPLPEMSRTVRCDRLRPDDVVAKIDTIRKAQLEPTSVVAVRNADGTYDLGLRFEGFGKGVMHQVERMQCDALSEAEAAAFWKRHDECRTKGSLRIRVASLPTRLPAAHQAIAPLFEALNSPWFAWYATLGLGFAAGYVENDASAMASLHQARAALVNGGGSLVVECAPPAIRAEVDPWGPVGPAFEIMEQLKLRFDPDRRLNPGRFVGGL